MSDLINISVGNALVIAALGYAVVFFGLVLLMIVIFCMGKIMINAAARADAKALTKAAAKAAHPANASAAEASAAAANAPEGVKTSVAAVPSEETAPGRPAAPGSAGELKLYDTDPRDAAMIMAIVADSLGRPINELRFKSIREVKES